MSWRLMKLAPLCTIRVKPHKAARFCVRRRVKESEAVGQDGRVPSVTADPWAGQRHTARDGMQDGVGVGVPLGVEHVGDGAGAAPEQFQTAPGSVASPRPFPVPESPRSDGAQAPPLSQIVTEYPSASLGTKCVPSQAPVSGGSQYDNLSYDELQEAIAGKMPRRR